MQLDSRVNNKLFGANIFRNVEDTFNAFDGLDIVLNGSSNFSHHFRTGRRRLEVRCNGTGSIISLDICAGLCRWIGRNHPSGTKFIRHNATNRYLIFENRQKEIGTAENGHR